MADQPVTREKLIQADVDVENLGKAVNEETVVTPRYGNPYKSAPLTIKELQSKADQVVAQGFYQGYTTEALLMAAKPAVAEMRARADDTRKIYRWNRTSAEGVVPVTGTWVDTGLSDKDQAALFTNKVNETTLNLIKNQNPNLLQSTELKTGKGLSATTGLEFDSANFTTTDFIAVTAGEIYQIYARSNSNAACLAAYKLDKSLHSVLFTSSTSGTDYQIRNTEIPADVAFIRMCYITLGIDAHLKAVRSKIANHLIDTKYLSDAILNQGNIASGVSLTTGKYLTNNTVADSASFNYTDYIPVEPNSSYVSNANGVGAGASLAWYQSGVHFYDANKVLISIGSRVSPNVSFRTPYNCHFIRVNYIAASAAPLLIINKGDVILNDVVGLKIKDFMKTFDADDLLALYGYTTGKYVTTAGSESASANWAVTDFIPVEYEQKISYQAEASSIVSVISGYDANKNFVRSLVNGAGSLAISLGELDIPDDIAYIRFSFYWVNNQQKLRNVPKASGGGSGEPASNVSRYNGKTWLAMGTSIVDSQSTPYTYPVWVRDYFGFTLYDHAISGTRVRSCLQRATASIDARITASDFITIDHGTNDFKIETPMGTINDTPTSAANLKDPAYRDNTNTSGTFYGDLKGVIEYIYSVKPAARIYLITPIRRTAPAATGTDTNSLGLKLVDYRNAIVEVAKLYGLPLLDNYNESGFNERTIPVWTADGLHPTEWAQKNVLANKVIGFIESN